MSSGASSSNLLGLLFGGLPQSVVQSLLGGQGGSAQATGELSAFAKTLMSQLDGLVQSGQISIESLHSLRDMLGENGGELAQNLTHMLDELLQKAQMGQKDTGGNSLSSSEVMPETTSGKTGADPQAQDQAELLFALLRAGGVLPAQTGSVPGAPVQQSGSPLPADGESADGGASIEPAILLNPTEPRRLAMGGRVTSRDGQDRSGSTRDGLPVEELMPGRPRPDGFGSVAQEAGGGTQAAGGRLNPGQNLPPKADGADEGQEAGPDFLTRLGEATARMGGAAAAPAAAPGATPAMAGAASTSATVETLSATGATPAASTLSPNAVTTNTPSPAAQASAPLPTPVTHPQFGEAVGQRVVWMVGQQQQSAQIQLNPQELGPMSVRVEIQGDQATVHLAALHATTREALDAALPRLREMLADSGFTQVNVNVSSSGSQAGQQAQGQASGQGQGFTGRSGAGSGGEPGDAPPTVLESGLPRSGIDLFA